MAKTAKEVRNQEFTKTIIVDSENIDDSKVKLLLPCYALPEHEFKQLSSFGGGFSEWARRLFLASLWALVILLAKCIDYLINPEEATFAFKNYEFYAFGIAITICIVFWILSAIVKSDRTKLIKKVENHFKSNKNG